MKATIQQRESQIYLLYSFFWGYICFAFFFSPLGDIQSCHGEAFQYKQRLNRIMVKPTGYKPTTLSILT